ncbi:MAG TPA: formate dehydrogenase subunit delta [Steroidobacteraceae bacterium]|nr:formate dehydrogenase subunit delta [Steroidobacteraceae bacterium]
MSDAHLVKMANDIGAFFHAEPDREEAVGGIVNHITKFWTRRMREKLVASLRAGETAGFDELTLEAVRRLATATGAADRAQNVS